jgi:hypothetical protein
MVESYEGLPDKDEFGTLITIIELPTEALELVVEVLDRAGFRLGSSGGRYSSMERWGNITDEEIVDLKAKMADLLFEFETYNIEEEDYPLV